jgi:hypothetical protein
MESSASVIPWHGLRLRQRGSALNIWQVAKGLRFRQLGDERFLWGGLDRLIATLSVIKNHHQE